MTTDLNDGLVAKTPRLFPVLLYISLCFEEEISVSESDVLRYQTNSKNCTICYATLRNSVPIKRLFLSKVHEIRTCITTGSYIGCETTSLNDSIIEYAITIRTITKK